MQLHSTCACYVFIFEFHTALIRQPVVPHATESLTEHLLTHLKIPCATFKNVSLCEIFFFYLSIFAIFRSV